MWSVSPPLRPANLILSLRLSSLDCLDTLLPYLTTVINNSLSSGVFPSVFKSATVTPLLKKPGLDPDTLKNHRPVSNLPFLSKILEKIVFNRIYSYITENQLLSEKQSGYRPKHSTQLQLTYLTHNIYKTLDEGRDLTAVYLDISKYFDKIWHAGLLTKCENEFNIAGPLLDWLRSYLTDRRQKVAIGNALSTVKTTNAGCPQGSVLGPLLALMYLNGLNDKTTNNILFYADDTSLYASHSDNDLDDVQTSLQQDLGAIQSYAKKWLITFNSTKTIQQTFSNKRRPTTPNLTFDGHPIQRVDVHKHLGLTLSKDNRSTSM